jgi:hypothetical protein
VGNGSLSPSSFIYTKVYATRFGTGCFSSLGVKIAAHMMEWSKKNRMPHGKETSETLCVWLYAAVSKGVLIWLWSLLCRPAWRKGLVFFLFAFLYYWLVASLSSSRKSEFVGAQGRWQRPNRETYQGCFQGDGVQDML